MKFIMMGVFIILMVGLFTLPVMFLWNILMPDIFGLPTIGLWQAVGLLLLSNALTGGIVIRGK